MTFISNRRDKYQNMVIVKNLYRVKRILSGLGAPMISGFWNKRNGLR